MLKPEQTYLLPQLTALHTRAHAAFGKAVGMHMSRFRVLYLLYVMGESAPGALLKRTVMDAAALTRVMKDFEDEGLIMRRPDPADARSRFAALTPAGAAKVAALVAARDQFVEDALAGLSPEENRALAALMRRVEANISKLAGAPAIGESLNIDPDRPENR